MAESISEGTLKQFSKQVGDHVEQDEEIATIETDKIDVAVNAPEAGTIRELLVNEEDTVTVGQDIAILELAGASSGARAEVAVQEPKSSTSNAQPTSSEPRLKESQVEPKQEAETDRKSSQGKLESKPSPTAKAESSLKPPSRKESSVNDQSSQSSTPGSIGSREERRVSHVLVREAVAYYGPQEACFQHV